MPPEYFREKQMTSINKDSCVPLIAQSPLEMENWMSISSATDAQTTRQGMTLMRSPQQDIRSMNLVLVKPQHKM